MIQNIFLIFFVLASQSISTQASDSQTTGLIRLATLLTIQHSHSPIGINGTESITSIAKPEAIFIEKFNGNRNEPLSTKHQFKQCLICLNTIHTNEMHTLECKHSFCKECVNHLIDNAIQEKDTSTLQCSMIDCRKKFEPQDIMAIVKNEKKRIKFKKIQNYEWMRQQPGFRQCPTPDCNYMFINDEQVKRTMHCKKCYERYCSNCLLKHTDDVSCKYAQYLADNPHRANKEWLEINTKKCPNCHKSIEKNEGCNHMTCARPAGCGHEFCWLCLGTYRWHNSTSCEQIQDQEALRIALRNSRRNNDDFETSSQNSQEDEILTNQSICSFCTIS